MEEQKFGDREMGRGWIRSEAGGKGGGTAGLTEAQVNGFDQSNGNSLTGKMHHGRIRALDGIGLELSQALEHGLCLLAQLAISRDNKGMEGFTPGLANVLIFCRLGLLNAGQHRVRIASSVSWAVQVDDADIQDGRCAHFMEAANAHITAEVESSRGWGCRGRRSRGIGGQRGRDRGLVDGAPVGDSGTGPGVQVGLTGDSTGGEALLGQADELIPDLIVAKVNEAAMSTIEGVHHATRAAAAITGGGEVCRGQAEAEMQVVPPFLSRENSAGAGIGESSQPSSSVLSAFQAALSGDRQGGRQGGKAGRGMGKRLGLSLKPALGQGTPVCGNAEGGGGRANGGLGGKQGTHNFHCGSLAGGQAGGARVDWIRESKTCKFDGELGQSPGRERGAVGSQLEQVRQEVAGNGLFQGGKNSWVAGCGALEVLPFQLEGVLEAHKGGLWEATRSLSEELDASEPGGDQGGDMSMGVRRGAKKAAEETVAGNQLNLGGASTEEGAGPGKVGGLGDKAALVGLHMVAKRGAKSNKPGEIEFQLGKRASSTVVISNPQLEELGELPEELLSQGGQGDAVSKHGQRISLNDTC